MLKKLYKYDFRATIGSTLPLSLAPIPLSIIFALCLCWILKSSGAVWNAIPGTFMVLSGLAIYICPIAVSISLFIRFYRSFFSDEGYLTMSLPVTSKKLLLSKLLFTATYQIIIFVSVILGIALILGICQLFLKVPIYEEIINFLIGIFSELIDSSPATILHIFLFCIEGVLIAFTAAFGSVMIIFCSITLGSLLFRRHPFLGTILFYFVISNVLSILNIIFTSAIDLFSILENIWYLHFSLLTAALMLGLVGIGLYFFVSWLIEKNLNLN